MDQSNHTQRKSSENFEYESSDSDAIFIGWQELRSGNRIAFYNITVAGHPSFGSTVTESSLRKMNLKVPDHLPPESVSET